jgi:hypothetical protein
MIPLVLGLFHRAHARHRRDRAAPLTHRATVLVAAAFCKEQDRDDACKCEGERVQFTGQMIRVSGTGSCLS